GIDVGGGDDLVGFLPARADEAAHAADRLVVLRLDWVPGDRGPSLDRRQGAARLTPQLHEAPPDQRVFQPVAAVEVPGVAGTARAAARLVVRHVRPGARIIGLLRLPGDQPVLDVDLPAARSGT